ncbi:hypothetical protein PTET_a3459 [Pseudoalteromonas tetraodonis]|nr:hypothetical protein PTET_a3459 [Pseudoalteromonas tetraodonis]
MAANTVNQLPLGITTTIKILVVFSYRIYTALAHSTMSGLFYFYDKLTAIVIF